MRHLYGQFMLTVLVFSVVLNMVLRFLEDTRNARSQQRLSRERRIIIDNVQSLARACHVMADTWGQQEPAKVRALLREALRVQHKPIGEDDDE